MNTTINNNEVMEKLLPYQRDHVRKLAQSILLNGYAGDFSDTGTGKSFNMIAVAKLLGKRPFIIVPKAALTQIRRVCVGHFGVEPIEVINREKLRRGNTGWGHWDANSKAKRFVWTIPDDALLIFDEVHCEKSPKSLNHRLLIAAKTQRIPTLVCSATAATSPLDMKALGFLMDLHRGTDFYPWLFRNGCYQTRFGLKFCGNPLVLQRIHQQLFSTGKCQRISIEDIADQFPETVIQPQIYDYDMAPEIRKAYSEMREQLLELERYKKENKLDKSQNPMVILQSALQKVELLKVPLFTELAQQYMDEGYAVAVFVNYSQTIDALADKLKTKNLIRGGMDNVERQSIMDNFRADKTNIVCLMSQAGGQSISLHGLSPNHKKRITIISPSFNAVHMVQVLGRVHRAEGSNSVQYIVYVAGTPEEKACQRVRSKVRNLSTLNDNDLTGDIYSEQTD